MPTPASVDRANRDQVGRTADVTADKTHACVGEPRQVELRAAAMKVVERDHIPIGMLRCQANCQVATYEPGTARDEDAHWRSS